MPPLRDFDAYVENRPTPPPPSLFKYMTFEGMHKTLTTSTIRSCSPLTFNDPFDVQWSPTWNLSTPALVCNAYQRFWNEVFGAQLSNTFNLSSQNTRLFLQHRERLRNIRIDRRQAAFDEWFGPFRHIAARAFAYVEQGAIAVQTQLRIISMSNNPTSILMWSHYASSHTGVVLEWDTNILEQVLQSPAEPVRYSEHIPIAFDLEHFVDHLVYDTALPIPDRSQLADTWSLTKAAAWRYEQEWRFVIKSEDAPPYSFHAFPSSALKSIICGCRMSHTEVHTLRSLLDHLDLRVPVRIASAKSGEFAIHVD